MCCDRHFLLVMIILPPKAVRLQLGHSICSLSSYLSKSISKEQLGQMMMMVISLFVFFMFFFPVFLVIVTSAEHPPAGASVLSLSP
jgi:hypothetical protein